MPQPSVLSNVIGFLNRIGVYDVVLPFILVFTIVFAILEKTRVLGTEKIDDKEYSRKNLNSMVAFTVGFLVVASAQLVATITQVSSQMVILLLLGVFFLMLVGSFYEKEEWEKGKLGWPKTVFVGVVFVVLVFIFLNAITAADGRTWLTIFWQWLTGFWTSAAVASIILIIGIILFIYYITQAPKTEEAKEEKK